MRLPGEIVRDLLVRNAEEATRLSLRPQGMAQGSSFERTPLPLPCSEETVRNNPPASPKQQAPAIHPGPQLALVLWFQTSGPGRPIPRGPTLPTHRNADTPQHKQQAVASGRRSAESQLFLMVKRVGLGNLLVL